MREGRKVVIDPNQNTTTEIPSNSNETTSTSILRKNETTLQKDEEQRSNKESIHEYMNLTAAEEVLRIEEGRQKSKIENLYVRSKFSQKADFCSTCDPPLKGENFSL